MQATPKIPKVLLHQMSQPASSPTSVSIASASPFPLTTKSDILRDPKTNRGLVFTSAERSSLGINGLLPVSVASVELEILRFMTHLRGIEDPLQKFALLSYLKENDAELFFAVAAAHVTEIMPLVYTPVVGKACQEYSRLYIPRPGLYVTLGDAGNVATVLSNWREKDVRAICFTDGQRILGLGDLGANGMGIPVGKLALYTVCAGMPPQYTLPVTIDVGTDTTSLLEDPLYIGARHPRDRSEAYDALIDEFITAAMDTFGRTVLLQWEDFGNENAFRLLERYQDKCCTFNDDIQGTAGVTVAGLMSSCRVTGKTLADYTYLFYGAGMAGTGIADLIADSIAKDTGKPVADARKKIWLVDTKGLITANRTDLQSHKLPYAHVGDPQATLDAAVKALKPNVLIGVSASPGAFTPGIIADMASFNERPIIFSLSNPTSKSECTAEAAYTHSNGTALFASGSPFDPVTLNGVTHVPGQGNNSYIFPGLALGVVATQCSRVPNSMFLTAAQSLASQVSPAQLASGCLYPPLTEITEVSAHIAAAVAEEGYTLGVATAPKPDNMLQFIKAFQYKPYAGASASTPSKL